jgi:beta-xylosidase
VLCFRRAGVERIPTALARQATTPTTLNADQLRLLQQLTEDRPEIRTLRVDRSGTANVPLAMRQNDIVLIEIEPRTGKL